MSSTTHRFFVRLLLGQLALAALLAFPIDAKAQVRVGGSDFTFDERDQQREERREDRREERRDDRIGDRWDNSYNDRIGDRWDGRIEPLPPIRPLPPLRPLPPIGHDDEIRLYHSERVYGQTTIRVLQLANQQGDRLLGRTIESVTLEASSLGRFANAEARLVVDGRTEAFQLIRSGRDLVTFHIYGRGEVGRDLRSLHIEIRGDALVDGVIVQLERHRPGPRPLPGIHLRPMRDFHGRTSQTLEQAFALPYQHANRLVTEVRLQATSINSGELSLVDIGRGPLGRHLIGRWGQTVVIRLPQAVPLRDLGINMLNHVRVETLDIEFLR
jgi:hypothetical protein